MDIELGDHDFYFGPDVLADLAGFTNLNLSMVARTATSHLEIS